MFVGAGRIPPIQGFAHGGERHRGATVNFQHQYQQTPASKRPGCVYRPATTTFGLGARKVGTAAVTPHVQPACRPNPSPAWWMERHLDESAAWSVPVTSVRHYKSPRVLSARMRPADRAPMVFVCAIRRRASPTSVPDGRHDVQADNQYGGNTLYASAAGAPRAYTRSATTTALTRSARRTPMMGVSTPSTRCCASRFNGSTVSYASGASDTTAGRRICSTQGLPRGRPRRVLVVTARANVEAARAAGVNLAFFNGNEIC